MAHDRWISVSHDDVNPGRRAVGRLTGIGLVSDLAFLPASAPTLAAFYGELRAGRMDLQEPRGRRAFALALLQTGLVGSISVART